MWIDTILWYLFHLGGAITIILRALLTLLLISIVKINQSVQNSSLSGCQRSQKTEKDEIKQTAMIRQGLTRKNQNHSDHELLAKMRDYRRLTDLCNFWRLINGRDYVESLIAAGFWAPDGFSGEDVDVERRRRSDGWRAKKKNPISTNIRGLPRGVWGEE